jgi:hypothetical protein
MPSLPDPSEVPVRHLTIVRSAALLTAAALALTAGPTAAAESRDFTKPSVEKHRGAKLATGADLERSSTASTVAAAPSVVDVQKISAYSLELSNKSDNNVPIDITLAKGTDRSTIDHVSVTVSVDGKRSGPFKVYEDLGVTYVVLPDTVGLGHARFVKTTVHYTEGSGLAPTDDTTRSNLFYVRRAITHWATSYKTKGITRTLTADGFGIYDPATHDYVSLKRVKLQYKTDGRWKSKKVVSLNAEGDGKYTWRASNFYKYRLYSATTETAEGLSITVPKAR